LFEELSKIECLDSTFVKVWI